MDWIPVIVTTLLTPLLTGVVVYLLQLRWQEGMKKRLTQFSNLHEKRVEVIAELYGLLLAMGLDLRSAVSAVSGEARLAISAEPIVYTEGYIQRRLDEARESVEAFEGYFRRHRIYLPESLVEKTERFCAQTRATSIGLLLTHLRGTDASQDESRKQEYETSLKEVSEEVSRKIPSLSQDIETEFRELLGN